MPSEKEHIFDDTQVSIAPLLATEDHEGLAKGEENGEDIR